MTNSDNKYRPAVSRAALAFVLMFAFTLLFLLISNGTQGALERVAKFLAALVAAHYLALGKQWARVTVALTSVVCGGANLFGALVFLTSENKAAQLVGLSLLALGLGYWIVAGILTFSKQIAEECPNAHFVMEMEDQKVLQESLHKLSQEERTA